MVAHNHLVYEEKHPPPHPSWKLAGNTDPLHRRALIVLLGFGQNRRLPTPLVKRESSMHLFLLLIIVRAAQEKNRGCRRVDWYRSYGRKTSFNPSLSNFKGVALWRWLALLALNSKHASQIRWHIHLRTPLPCVPRLIRTRHSLCSRFMLPPVPSSISRYCTEHAHVHRSARPPRAYPRSLLASQFVRFGQMLFHISTWYAKIDTILVGHNTMHKGRTETVLPRSSFCPAIAIRIEAIRPTRVMLASLPAGSPVRRKTARNTPPAW